MSKTALFERKQDGSFQAQKLKISFITGITGQDGSYLAEWLLLQGNYLAIYGLTRRSSVDNCIRINHIKRHLELRFGDLLDANSIVSILFEIKNRMNHDSIQLEIYNLAAQSDVAVSFQCPTYTSEVNFVGMLNILEAVRTLNLVDKTRFYQAGTSEQFGDVLETPQSETTPFNPISPYSTSKMAAFHMVNTYRRAYKMFCVTGILFNHESPRRGENFVTRKITRFVSKHYYRAYVDKQREEKEKTTTKIEQNKKELVTVIETLKLGNLDSLRDWGHARDYVEAMWLMLQQDVPKDYVISTGKQTSVRQFVEMCFEMCDIHIVWINHGENECGYDSNLPEDQRTDQNCLVAVDVCLYRPNDVVNLLGNSQKAQNELGWYAKTLIHDLILEMLQN